MKSDPESDGRYGLGISEDWRSITSVNRLVLFGALASSIAAVLIAVATYKSVSDYMRLYTATYETQRGEVNTVSLPDGSVIQLNTNSQVTVDFESQERTVYLVRGEASFQVVPDLERPFSVKAGVGAITAVGTAFSVHLQDNLVDVTVSEGRVALATQYLDSEVAVGNLGTRRQVMSLRPLLELTSGQTALFGYKIEKLEHLEEPSMTRKLSWREGQLSYVGEPLSKVLADIRRYTGASIEMEGQTLSEKRVTGSLHIASVSQMLEALQLMSNVKVQRSGDKYVIFMPPSDN